jgi:hypothetical protein
MGSADYILILEPPSFTCSHCRFSSHVKGNWSVENGRLVFLAEEDPQPRRGPDLDGCCEGNDCGEFASIITEGREHQVIRGTELEVLRRTARESSKKKTSEYQSLTEKENRT